MTTGSESRKRPRRDYRPELATCGRARLLTPAGRVAGVYRRVLERLDHETAARQVRVRRLEMLSTDSGAGGFVGRGLLEQLAETDLRLDERPPAGQSAEPPDSRDRRGCRPPGRGRRPPTSSGATSQSSAIRRTVVGVRRDVDRPIRRGSPTRIAAGGRVATRATNAAATSRTWIRSRTRSPSSQIRGARPARQRAAKIAATPV